MEALLAAPARACPSRGLGKPESHPDDELVEALLALTRGDDERVRTGRLRQASGAVTG